MSWLTLMMILAAAGAAYWSSARAAAERATRLGHDACRNAGVQLIDHSVHGDRVRLRRHGNGRLGVEHSFRFYWSDDGIQRHAGRMVLFGDRLVSFSGPVPARDRLPGPD